MADSVPAGVAGDGGRRELTLFLGAAAELAGAPGRCSRSSTRAGSCASRSGSASGSRVYFDLAAEPAWWIGAGSGVGAAGGARAGRCGVAAPRPGSCLRSRRLRWRGARAVARQRVAAPVLAARCGPGRARAGGSSRSSTGPRGGGSFSTASPSPASPPTPRRRGSASARRRGGRGNARRARRGAREPASRRRSRRSPAPTTFAATPGSSGSARSAPRTARRG